MPTEADYRFADEWLAPYLDIRAMPSREIARERLAEKLAQARDEALEEAIRAIDDISWDWPSPWIDDAEAFKAAIRALKEKRGG